MSRGTRTLQDLLALEQPCPTCDTPSGVWCRIRPGFKGAGDPASYIHVARSWATYHARWVGYTEGRLEGLQHLHQLVNDPHVGELEIHRILDEQIAQAERWAQSAHQRALLDIPEDWHQ